MIPRAQRGSESMIPQANPDSLLMVLSKHFIYICAGCTPRECHRAMGESLLVLDGISFVILNLSLYMIPGNPVELTWIGLASMLFSSYLSKVRPIIIVLLVLEYNDKNY